MSETLQWMIVGIIVALSAWYLCKRLARPKTCAGSGCCCESCPLSPEQRAQCSELVSCPDGRHTTSR